MVIFIVEIIKLSISEFDINNIYYRDMALMADNDK